MKDPAFLFYGKDFYEGTRTMLPEERACIIDLLIYQHQHNGYIPNDLKRLKMYCSGIDEATLLATLEAKFVLTDTGWQNGKMQILTEERNSFKEGQSINGKVGQFYKKAYKLLTKSEQKKLKIQINKLCLNNEDLYNNWITKHQDPKAMLQAMLEHIVNVNGDGDEIVNSIVTRSVSGSGERYLELFLREYISIFKEKVNPSCPKCLTDYLNRYKNHFKAMANTCNYRLHAKYENIPLEFGSPILVNNANITDEYAQKLIAHNNGERYFAQMPKSKTSVKNPTSKKKKQISVRTSPSDTEMVPALGVREPVNISGNSPSE